MRMLRSTVLIGCALASAPATAQVRPPEFVARQAGGVDCARLQREAGAANVVRGRFVQRGPTAVFNVTADFDVRFCFRQITECERFVTEMRFDYPEGTGSCATGG